MLQGSQIVQLEDPNRPACFGIVLNACTQPAVLVTCVLKDKHLRYAHGLIMVPAFAAFMVGGVPRCFWSPALEGRVVVVVVVVAVQTLYM